ncbi:MAG: hypothetical protein KGJ93_00655 [Patescibacteria group bacterium]|nr:hypothetical protein [Patescibacteria group bacterium]
MNIVAVSGPKGAGKDTLIKALIKKAEQDFPAGFVERAIITTDRIPRLDEIPGQDIESVSREQFDELTARQEILFPKTISGAIEYRNGVRPSELNKAAVVILNIVGSYVPQLKELTEKTNGKVYGIFLHTGKVQRAERIGRREELLFPEMISSTVEADPGRIDVRSLKNFDSFIENREGFFERTAEQAYRELKPFLQSIFKPQASHGT